MKVMLSLIVVCMLAGIASAQPPRGSKFGAGEGQFGDPAKMAEMRENMRQRWQHEEDRVPGPPPWAGRGMRMGGPRGPQYPFLDKSPQDSPTRPRADLRRSDSKNQISGDRIDNRGRGWQSRNNDYSYKGYSTKKSKSRGDNQGSKIIIVIKIN